MTQQSSDYVIYKRKRYTLIDCESNLIKTADFGLGVSKDKHTGCYRGYIAIYGIIKDTLYGVKLNEEFDFENGFKVNYIKSKRMKMNYTGSILVALPGSDYFNSDFIDGYLFSDEAFELYFIDGKLKEVISLKEAIDGWINEDKRIDEENKILRKKGKLEDKHAGYMRKADIRDKYAKKHLKYKYCNYKWTTTG